MSDSQELYKSLKNFNSSNFDYDVMINFIARNDQLDEHCHKSIFQIICNYCLEHGMNIDHVVVKKEERDEYIVDVNMSQIPKNLLTMIYKFINLHMDFDRCR